MKQEHREAFTEVYEIFGLMPETLLRKIPNKFYEMIKNERAKEYQPNIKEPLEQIFDIIKSIFHRNRIR